MRTHLVFCLGILGALLANGCSSHCGAMREHPAPVKPAEISGKFGPRPMVIFRSSNEGPVRPILLLHELPGLNECTAAFADALTKKGFTVYAPVMVGAPLEPGGWARFRNELTVTFSPAWPTWSRERSPAVLPDLRDAVHKIREAHPAASIGVIGMCMSGTIPLALMSEEHVQIAAICQPALPFKVSDAFRRDLGLSPKDRDDGIGRIKKHNLRVLGYRFESDTISPHERMSALAVWLGDNFELDEICRLKVPEKNHATFTFSYDPTPGSETQIRFERLTEKFRTVLEKAPSE